MDARRIKPRIAFRTPWFSGFRDSPSTTKTESYDFRGGRLLEGEEVEARRCELEEQQNMRFSIDREGSPSHFSHDGLRARSPRKLPIVTARLFRRTRRWKEG